MDDGIVVLRDSGTEMRRGMAKAVTLADIAKKAGVSTVTVSNALSGQKGVSDEMREKIRRIADELGYVKPASSEKNDSSKKSLTVGVAVMERYLQEYQSFYWSLYQEISRCAMEMNCLTMLEIVSYEAERKHWIPKVVSENKVDALIAMGTFEKACARFWQNTLTVPLLFLDEMDPLGTGDAVVINNIMGAYTVTNYLFEQGHTRIGFVGTRMSTTSIDNRFFGYVKSMMEHGMEIRKDWLIDDRDRETGKMDEENCFVLPEDMPTAFFCNCDLTASLLIRKLKKSGYSVPEDISVAGFDHFLSVQAMGISDISITTYEVDLREMARRGIQTLLHRIENPNSPGGIIMVGGGRFVEGDSTRRIGLPVPFI